MTQLNLFFWRGNFTLLIKAKCFRQLSISFCVPFLILDVPNEIKSESCEVKEEKPETACHSHGIREQASEQLEQKESTMHTNGRSAADTKVSASKPRRAGRKLGAKK